MESVWLTDLSKSDRIFHYLKMIDYYKVYFSESDGIFILVQSIDWLSDKEIKLAWWIPILQKWEEFW